MSLHQMCEAIQAVLSSDLSFAETIARLNHLAQEQS